MSESQNIEYKESWRTEYLKWVCGFANAQGGTIYIGIDDAGKVVGLKDVKKLMDDIPNQIHSGLGIIADVNRRTQDGLDYIEIKVNPSTYPVNYHGEYHYRSGSTKQQLQGAALTEFIREKTGYLWDAVPVDNISVSDLDPNSIAIFRREAVRKKRMDKEDLDISNEELMDHLDFLVGGKLKRAAVMLFYHKPGRIITGCYVKVGKFGEGSDLLYQDTVEGSLFSIADRGIQKICETCRELGTADPEYTVLGDDLTVKFTALESAKVSDSKVPKHQNDVLDDVLENRIVNALQKDAKLNQKELAKELKTSLPSIQRAMNKLKESGRIVRNGGKRYGYWEIK